MPTITPQHLDRLIALESRARYNQPPPPGSETFVVEERPAAVLLSAPHGAITYRNNTREVWHDEDEYTAGFALLLGELCAVPVVATLWKNLNYDPNNTRRENLPYRNAVRRLIRAHGVRFVLDLHGAGISSAVLAPCQTIDLGYRQIRGIPPHRQPHPPSMEAHHIAQFETLLAAAAKESDPACFVVDHNRFAARGAGTITTLAVHEGQAATTGPIQALQIEMKPQVRILRRFPSASHYPSDGPYQANPACVRAMLQALADFIEYLKTAA